MNGKIYLCGGGNEKQTYKVDEEFLKDINSILYIPWAWKDDNFQSCEEWFKKCMTQHKIVKIKTLIKT